MLAIGAVRGQEINGNRQGFTVPLEKESVRNAFEDFERYRDKKAWEKAFAALTVIADTKPGKLVAAKDGFYVPATRNLRDELLTLNAEGRQAYRLFNDAKAKQALDQLRTADNDSTGARKPRAKPKIKPALRHLVDLYFITSIGDQAADRWGDALFEAGEFLAAADAWNLILRNYPDTSLSPALLQTKCAIALFRADRRDDLAAIQAALHQQYSGQTVHLGGRDVVAADFVDELARQAVPNTDQHPQGIIASTLAQECDKDSAFKLPASDTPAWQFAFADPRSSSRCRPS